MQTVLEHLRNDNKDGNHNRTLNGYYGTIFSVLFVYVFIRIISGVVINLFESESRFNRAIEVTAEGRLFYHVVENDQIAMLLLKLINERDLRGEINFFPLNRIVPKPRRTVNDPVFL